MEVEKFEGKVQRQILISMITSKEVLSNIVPKWTKEGLFESKWCNIVGGWCVKHFTQYSKPPGKRIQQRFDHWAQRGEKETVKLVSRFLQSLSDEYKPDGEPNHEYILELASEHFNVHAAKKLNREVEKEIERGKVREALNKINTFHPIELGQTGTVDILLDKEAIRQAFAEKREPLIKIDGALGRFFGHAITRDAFISFVGPEKSGKSFWLLKMAWLGMLQRLNVAMFVVGDMSQDQVMHRFMEMACRRPFLKTRKDEPVKIPTSIERGPEDKFATISYKEKEYADDMVWQDAMAACEKIMLNEVKSKQPKLKLKCFPGGMVNVLGIKSEIDTFIRGGFIPDVVCIASGQLVTTRRGLVPIEQIRYDDRLWDGSNWVSHGGLVYKGYKGVITYDGITATPDHEVWTEEGWRSLITCSQMGLRIARTGFNGQALRLGGNSFINCESSRYERSKEVQEQILRSISSQAICRSRMYEMSPEEMDFNEQLAERNCRWLSEMQAAEVGAILVIQEVEQRERSLHKSKQLQIQGLWSERYPVQLQVSCIGVPMGCEESWDVSAIGNRQDRKQWALRTRQYPMVDSFGELPEHTKTKAHVWDILNAGPLNRFTVSDRLVHNCIDYADNLAPIDGRIETRHQINATWQAMRGISQIFHCCLFTATQANAKSYGAYILGPQHFSESKMKNAQVTGMVGINQIEEEKDMDVTRLNWIELRGEAFSRKKCVSVAGCRSIANIAMKSTW